MANNGKKPAMRVLTKEEVANCKSCDGLGHRLPGGVIGVGVIEVPEGQVCWFGCETPIDGTLKPGWVVDYDG